jgi:colicin import membrane protein
MQVSREYIIPVTFTVVLHALLLVWLIGSFISEPRVFELPQPKFVKATLVSMEQQKKKGPQQEFKQPKPPKVQPKIEPKPDPKPVEKPPVKKAEPKPEPKPKPVIKPTPKVEKPKVEKPKIDEAKLKAEADKKLKEDAKKKQAELDKKRQQEEEKRKQAEAEKQRKAEQQRRAEALLDSMDDDKAQEESDPNSDAAVSTESYVAMIQRAVIANWSRPISARNGMQVLLRIQLIPTGDVVGVTVYKSSGDLAFDRSAIVAVEKARQFPELAELDSRTFEKNFRMFILNFNPQDLRL